VLFCPEFIDKKSAKRRSSYTSAAMLWQPVDGSAASFGSQGAVGWGVLDGEHDDLWGFGLMRLCCMEAGCEGRWTQYPLPSLLFKRYGHNSGAQTRACGSGPQQRWQLRSPRFGRCEIEGHRQSPVCIARSTPRPWLADCSRWPFATPSCRFWRSFAGGGRGECPECGGMGTRAI
jgi:hypothetical protein